MLKWNNLNNPKQKLKKSILLLVYYNPYILQAKQIKWSTKLKIWEFVKVDLHKFLT